MINIHPLNVIIRTSKMHARLKIISANFPTRSDKVVLSFLSLDGRVNLKNYRKVTQSLQKSPSHIAAPNQEGVTSQLENQNVHTQLSCRSSPWELTTLSWNEVYQ